LGIFIDRHDVFYIETAVRRQLQFEAQHGIRDASGTLPLGHWVEDGSIYCLLEAPDEDAVCRHHRARGVRCDELHALVGVNGSRPLSGSDRAVIKAAIERFWHAPAAPA
jgi:hypothetical protein